ncbi:zinc finger and BTB domain-containing protein 44 isoform X1 [Maylandia zebra]|uniref:Zinc finger and BTB domain-containing protein 44 n=1 Tax=Astatotilapia calliptera TaxID=8154 RepID=A0A3P8QE87_ASTCA|nr:zinc finger and BTB domain-containing protein 44 isoform X1 [Maylandia zebra]XP_004537998.1 zinc finger and BTB domain-containing protein 44 isoform X1 [Maylandia zebra]XP_026047702.1 zinc finger and BTB domain-containing protein 44 isoform X1 [Astatotilapia calliptera]XP_026047703.1 zinc finger and BTB domain-containing protein 44 isoform X1 [Astatotilapia calliptera]XP_026047704.1 zinc finger and BTB domain-containing protein 44 isoform X1 [Astatotilapia calliptera]
MGVKTFTHSSTSHSQEMLEKLNALRNEGHLCDVTIRVQDKLFLAHKVVLACCSEFFRSKLVGRPEEEDKFVLDLHHVTVSGFAPLLEYAYTSTLSISTENIIDVLAAASYMQMFAVASTCSEFMKSSILWTPGNNNNNNNMGADKPHESAPESASSNCALTPLDGSVSPVSSDCSVMERNVPICRESRRKRKSFVSMASPESPLKCTTQMVTTSPQIPNPSPSFSDSAAQPVESSLAFPWTFPFGIDRRFHSDKSKLPESPRCLEQGTPGTSEVVVGRRLSDFLTCESSKTVSSPVAAEEEDVRVKVERLSDEEVQEASSQPVSASQSSLSDQQTVPGSEQVQEELLISPQSSSIGSMDEGVSEGLPSMQSTSNAGGHAEDDERLEGIQYPYHLYISPSTRPGTNGPDRPFQCPTCGVRFTRIQNLKQHMLIHSGIKPFQCDRCGKKFTRAYSLKMHRLKHEGKRCFRCQICSATFTSFGEYKHHMRVSRHIIRKPRIYECKTCGAMFTNSGNLIVHLRSLNHEASELANYFQSSDFLVPDYLSQVQEEEEALGVQYELEETQHHPVYPGSTSASTTTPASSSSSVQMPVISQVSSSTQNCESSSGFLSPEPLDPLEAPASPKMDADDTAPMTEETKMDNSVGGSSPEVFEEEQQQQQHARAKEVASITIK